MTYFTVIIFAFAALFYYSHHLFENKHFLIKLSFFNLNLKQILSVISSILVVIKALSSILIHHSNDQMYDFLPLIFGFINETYRSLCLSSLFHPINEV